MPNCLAIKTQLDGLIEQRQSVEQELEAAHSPSERSALIFELKTLNREIAAKQQQYNHCIHPPLPKPDLVAKTFQIKPNHVAIAIFRQTLLTELLLFKCNLRFF